jgi:hypothetical protein
MLFSVTFNVAKRDVWMLVALREKRNQKKKETIAKRLLLPVFVQMLLTLAWRQ